MADDYTCNIYGECYSSRWSSWGRWVFLVFMIIGFWVLIAMCMAISARRRRNAGLRPMVGTAWLAPKNRYPAHHNYWPGGAEPGPPGPAGYYPPPPQDQGAYHGNYYTPPPYSPNPQFTGTTTTNTDAYFAPPPGPPPGHPEAYEMQTQPGRNGSGGSPAPPVPVDTHPTGESTHSYVQSNNPFQLPATPPPVHVTDIHGNPIPRKE
ncbi:hypothetical protein FN846DRAFT_610886 [Sphaerosporella brunnea]|uniref:Chitin synthesis regulation, resistance to congo red-domain-containing protein n=1 Tax=Sphaerosporella brunnea TaxID=1250544 RepID=A0A5J5F0R4_9PEZI|nr:hypothetical protein FN846DRAFT_610886 [Sphaerosporella brunnea]